MGVFIGRINGLNLHCLTILLIDCLPYSLNQFKGAYVKVACEYGILMIAGFLPYLIYDSCIYVHICLMCNQNRHSWNLFSSLSRHIGHFSIPSRWPISIHVDWNHHCCIIQRKHSILERKVGFILARTGSADILWYAHPALCYFRHISNAPL